MKKNYFIAFIFFIIILIILFIWSLPSNKTDSNSKVQKNQEKSILQNIAQRIVAMPKKKNAMAAPSITPTTNDTSPLPRVSLTIGEIIPPNIQSQNKQNIERSTYEHPQLHYKVSYPSSWKAETLDAPYPEYDGYLDVRIYPFGNQTRINQYQSTPEIIIRVEDTNKALEQYFEEDPLGKQRAEKLQKTTISSVPAYIYDWSFESTIFQTTALFVKDGRAYKIQLTWSSQEQKDSSLDEFVMIYQSFSE